jgi:hypothetical protein
MRTDSANNKSNYSEKEPPNSDSRWRRFTLERVFGERRSQETFFSLDRKERYFLAFQPLCVETRGWVVPRILHGSISIASLLSSDDVDRFLELASRGGCLVGNT